MATWVNDINEVYVLYPIIVKWTREIFLCGRSFRQNLEFPVDAGNNPSPV